MKILVTGGSGLLGKYLHANELAYTDVEYTWFSNKQPWCAHRLDVRDLHQVKYVFGKVRPEAVLHMAGVGNVDFCERNYKVADATNAQGSRHVMEVAADYQAQVLMTSTNAVFEGTNPPYKEGDERAPVNAYGKIRKAAEFAVTREGGSVVRLFLLYGWEPEGARGNWASGAVRKLQAGQRMRVVNDRWYMPTYADDAARAVWALLGQGQRDNSRGIYHVAGADRVTLHQFVVNVAETWKLDPSLVEPCSFDSLEGLAPRPVDSSYELERAQELGIACRGVEDGLEGMWQEWI